MTKAAHQKHIETLLRRALELRAGGASSAKAARIQGEADGYMRALIDTGVFAPGELLNVVGRVRRQLGGPATGTVEADRIDRIVSAA